MSMLSGAVDISELGQRNLWAVWGKSGTGKTAFLATAPKPMLYISIGDDGSNTIANVEGISALTIETPEQLKELGKELIKDKKFASVGIDTFSLFTNVWIDQNITQKKKRMTQNDWGNLKVETEELIKIFHQVAKNHVVMLSCHESNDTIEGMEDEIIPDFRPSITKGARTYLEGMANYGIHTTKVNKIVTTKSGEEKEVVRYAAHLGANPYYWTKLQLDPSIKIPELVINPTYDKIVNIIQGGH